MKVGLIYPQIDLHGDAQAVRAIGTAVEALGYDHIQTYDHMLGSKRKQESAAPAYAVDRDPFHDPLVMFSFLAGVTQKIRLISGILILPQRQTALVARQAADLDILSNERFIMGVGIGSSSVEYEAMGQNFQTRGRRMTEQVGLLRRLWSEDTVSHGGVFDRLDQVALLPKPNRSIPIWFGGVSDVALRRAAALGEGFIFTHGSEGTFKRIRQLQTYLAQNPRTKPFAIHGNLPPMASPQAVVDAVQRWHDAGGTSVSINTMGLGFKNVIEHIAYAKSVATILRSSGEKWLNDL